MVHVPNYKNKKKISTGPSFSMRVCMNLEKFIAYRLQLLKLLFFMEPNIQLATDIWRILYLLVSGELKLIKEFLHYPSNVEWCSISLALQDFSFTRTSWNRTETDLNHDLSLKWRCSLNFQQIPQKGYKNTKARSLDSN